MPGPGSPFSGHERFPARQWCRHRPSGLRMMRERELSIKVRSNMIKAACRMCSISLDVLLGMSPPVAGQVSSGGGADFPGVNPFWQIADQLERGVEPGVAAGIVSSRHRAMRHSPRGNGAGRRWWQASGWR